LLRALGSLSRGSLISGSSTVAVSTTARITATTSGTSTSAAAAGRGQRGVENSSRDVGNGGPLLLSMRADYWALVGLLLGLLLLFTDGDLGSRPGSRILNWGY
jgi:hypothetical protein